MNKTLRLLALAFLSVALIAPVVHAKPVKPAPGKTVKEARSASTAKRKPAQVNLAKRKSPTSTVAKRKSASATVAKGKVSNGTAGFAVAGERKREKRAL